MYSKGGREIRLQSQYGERKAIHVLVSKLIVSVFGLLILYHVVSVYLILRHSV